jgi:hypothetical protein
MPTSRQSDATHPDHATPRCELSTLMLFVFERAVKPRAIGRRLSPRLSPILHAVHEDIIKSSGLAIPSAFAAWTRSGASIPLTEPRVIVTDVQRMILGSLRKPSSCAPLPERIAPAARSWFGLRRDGIASRESIGTLRLLLATRELGSFRKKCASPDTIEIKYVTARVRAMLGAIHTVSAGVNCWAADSLGRSLTARVSRVSRSMIIHRKSFP